MRVGVTLRAWTICPNPNLIQAAKAAEQLGYDTLWVADRLLYPVKPRTKYPVTADGSLPQVYKRVLGPLDTLTFVAAHTTRIGLGTSVLDIPFYNPVTLARRLTTWIFYRTDGCAPVSVSAGQRTNSKRRARTQRNAAHAPMNSWLRSRPFGPKTRWSFTANISPCRARSSASSRCRNRVRRFISPPSRPPRSNAPRL